MSSTYYLLCMSHDPAQTVYEYRSLEEVTGTIPASVLEVHPNCDFLAMRISGAPVEFACLGIENDQCYGNHAVRWLAADVVRLLFYTEEDSPFTVRQLKNRPLFQCWTSQRLARLRNELDNVLDYKPPAEKD